jgi:hypothetical protein
LQPVSLVIAHHAEGLFDPNAMNQKMFTDFGCPRACTFRKTLNENRVWLLPLPTFFKTWFLLHKMWLKLAKKDFFRFFEKVSF